MQNSSYRVKRLHFYLYCQSSETPTYDTVIGGKKPLQSEVAPPEYETLQIKNDSLKGATSATKERNQEEMRDVSW